MDQHGQDLRAAPGEDLDLGHEPGVDPVADEAGQPLLHVQRIRYAANVAASVLDTDQQRPIRGVGERHDRLQGPVGRGEIALEFQRLALRALENILQVGHARKYTRKQRSRSSFRVAAAGWLDQTAFCPFLQGVIANSKG